MAWDEEAESSWDNSAVLCRNVNAAVLQMAKHVIPWQSCCVLAVHTPSAAGAGK